MQQSWNHKTLVGPIPLYECHTHHTTLTDPYYNLLTLPSAAKPVSPISTRTTHVSLEYRFSMYTKNAHA